MTGGQQTGGELWAAAVAGDPEAFALWFDQHRDRVYGHACRLLGRRTDAEDATATAFLELWRRRESVRLVDGSVLPWLLVTTTNVARNITRSARRYRHLLDRLPRESAASDAAVEAMAHLDGFDPELASRLQSLKAVDMALLSLVVLEGYPIAEAADVVGLSEGAARNRLHRSRGPLRRDLPEPTSEGARP